MQNYPVFFNEVVPIVLHDPLAEFLGACEDGILSYSYFDVVKFAGHSCPTVAGAYLMLREGIKTLHPDSIPQRGNLYITLKGPVNAGINGVISSVASYITGATELNGFQGLSGTFSRRNLMHYETDLPYQIHIRRNDSLAWVGMNYHPEKIPPHPQMGDWMHQLVTQTKNPTIHALFKMAWQERVRRILQEHETLNIITYEKGNQ